MACWSILAIPWRTKTPPSGPSGRGSVCCKPWTRSTPADAAPWRPLSRAAGDPYRLVVVGEVGQAPGRNTWRSARLPTSRPVCKGWPRPIPGDQCRDLAAPQRLLCLPGVSPMRLHGRTQPLEVYQVLAETTAAVPGRGWAHRPDPLVGREPEVGLLRERWRRSRMAWGRWCCSVAKRGLANRAWCRCCRNRWPRAPGVADAVPVFALFTSTRLCIP